MIFPPKCKEIPYGTKFTFRKCVLALEERESKDKRQRAGG